MKGFFLPFLFITSAMAADPVAPASSFLNLPMNGQPVTGRSGFPLTAPSPVPTAKFNNIIPSQLVGGSVDYKRFRDPFKEPEISEESLNRSELEKYSVTDFKVTGIITGPIRMRAMVLAPDGKTHYVSEKMKMGTRDGVVVKITTKTVVVREKVLNPLGEVELFETEIGMDHETQNQQ